MAVVGALNKAVTQEPLKVWKFAPDKPSLGLQPLSLPVGVASLDEASAHLPSGAYTTLRTFAGVQALRLQDHFQRLEGTAGMVGHSLRLDGPALRLALRQVIQAYPSGQDLRLRLTLDLELQPGDLYIAAQPLEIPPPQAYREGVLAVTTRLRRQLPKAKLTRFIARAGEVRQGLPSGVNEAIMLDPQDRLLEGLSSNFFAVKQNTPEDYEIWTAEEGVLSGVTRSLALESIQQLGFPVHLEPVSVSDLPLLAEAFITSASRAILPVRQIDQVIIGSGRPGEITRLLMEHYTARLHLELADI